MVSSGLAPYKLPRALDSLLLYQQPSSTTLYYSYLRVSALIEIRLSNETRGITHVSTVFVNHIALLLRKSNPLVNGCFPLLTFFLLSHLPLYFTLLVIS